MHFRSGKGMKIKVSPEFLRCTIQKMRKPIPLRDAVLLIWTLPRAKKHVTGIFFASPYGDAALFESILIRIRKGEAKGTRLHFHSQRGMKIKVSPGPSPASNSPPDCCI